MSMVEKAKSSRNPDWNRDELLLVLDLYFSKSASIPGKTSTEVIELSALLNKMHRLQGTVVSDTLRNANGVYLKLMDLRAIDPTFTSQGKVGMQSGGSLEKRLWAEYVGRRAQLAAEATTIRQLIVAANEASTVTLPRVEPYEGEEGGFIVSLHKRYERDRRLISEKLKEAGIAPNFSCEVCSFNFGAVYGALGSHFIEVHHVKPVHTMLKRSKVKLADLALLCSNCHRMAHRRRLPLSIDELKAALTNKSEGK